MTIFLAKNARREMAFNGPMRSGLVIDSRALLSRGYDEYQAEFTEHMGLGSPGEWYAPGHAVRGNKMQIDADTRRGRTIIPGYFIGRTLACGALAEALKAHELPATVRHGETCAFHIKTLDVRLYDMGYASATFTGEIEALQNLTLDQYRATAEKASSGLSAYRPLFLETIERVAAALRPDFTVVNFHGNSAKNEYWVNSSLSQGVGDLFWVHRVFYIACQDAKEYAKLKEPCKGLIYSEHASLVEDSSIADGLSFYPGNGNSAAVYDKSAAKPEALNPLLGMIRAQNVFYVAAEDIDRDLFYLGNDLDRQKHSQNMGLLEKQSETIVEYQSKVTLFKAVYDDFDNSLDPQGLKIWHALEKAWHTRDRFDNLNTKLDLVEKIYGRIRENLDYLQNKKLGVFMLAFTLISTLSVIVDTVDFTQGGALEAPSPLRVTVLAAMLLLAAAFALRILRKQKPRV